jgi:hypothetical protein
MLTKMYKICPSSSLMKEKDATSPVDYSQSQNSEKARPKGAIRLIDRLFTPHIL